MTLIIIYIILMALCFTNTFQGVTVEFYLKYILSIIWIIVFLISLIKKRKTYKKSIQFGKMFLIPYILIFIWSFFCLFVHGNLEIQYISRLIGQILYLLITYTSVLAGVHFFGKKTIKYSLYAMFLSLTINLITTINIYGLSNFTEYLKLMFFNVTFPKGTVMSAISGSLEVQDITIASGLYIIYYLFFAKKIDNCEDHKKEILIAIICFILGYKRTGLIALSLAIIFYLIIKKLKIDSQKSILLITTIVLGSSFLYLIFIKYNIIGSITTKYNINAMGRVQIYQMLSSFYDLVPWFIGQGYSYVDKVMYESITFVSHTVIGKMYAELGCIPFVLWAIHFLRNNSKKICKNWGQENCDLYLICIFYIFITFFFENTLTLYCIQYSLLLIPLACKLSKVGEKNE